jgi:hypothetical protein
MIYEMNLDTRDFPHLQNVKTSSGEHPASLNIIRGSADKSLARPGRKQATGTKLGIYSTYSPRSSIHFSCHAFQAAQSSATRQASKAVPSLTTSRSIHMNWHSNYLSIVVSNGFVRRLYFPKWWLLPQIKCNQNLPNLNLNMNSKYTKHVI